MHTEAAQRPLSNGPMETGSIHVNNTLPPAYDEGIYFSTVARVCPPNDNSTDDQKKKVYEAIPAPEPTIACTALSHACERTTSAPHIANDEHHMSRKDKVQPENDQEPPQHISALSGYHPSSQASQSSQQDNLYNNPPDVSFERTRSNSVEEGQTFARYINPETDGPPLSAFRSASSVPTIVPTTRDEIKQTRKDFEKQAKMLKKLEKWHKKEEKLHKRGEKKLEKGDKDGEKILRKEEKMREKIVELEVKVDKEFEKRRL